MDNEIMAEGELKIKLFMENKIQLIHPAGKKAIKMDKVKYDLLKKAILNCLKIKREAFHTEILDFIIKDFIKQQITFDGSPGWYMEWVKMDLEARHEIIKIEGKPPLKYMINE